MFPTMHLQMSVLISSVINSFHTNITCILICLFASLHTTGLDKSVIRNLATTLSTASGFL
jgi:hypothetical protein